MQAWISRIFDWINPKDYEYGPTGFVGPYENNYYTSNMAIGSITESPYFDDYRGQYGPTGLTQPE